MKQSGVNTLASEWAEFEAKVLGGCPAGVREGLRVGFYAGAAAMLDHEADTEFKLSAAIEVRDFVAVYGDEAQRRVRRAAQHVGEAKRKGSA